MKLPKYCKPLLLLLLAILFLSPFSLLAQKNLQLASVLGDTITIKNGDRVQLKYLGEKGFPITVDGPFASLVDSVIWLSDPLPFLRAEPVYLEKLGFVSAAVPLPKLIGFRKISQGKQWAHIGIQTALAGSSFYLLFSESPTTQALRANPWASIGFSLGSALLSLSINRLFFPRKVNNNIQNGPYRVVY